MDKSGNHHEYMTILINYFSRCLREPIKAFTVQMGGKAAKKSFPFLWDKKVRSKL